MCPDCLKERETEQKPVKMDFLNDNNFVGWPRAFPKILRGDIVFLLKLSHYLVCN